MSNESRRALAYAAEEAERLEHKHIGTEHLLLGLLREEKSFAAKLLHDRNVGLEQARESVFGDLRGQSDLRPIEEYVKNLEAGA